MHDLASPPHKGLQIDSEQSSKLPTITFTYKGIQDSALHHLSFSASNNGSK